MAKYDNKERVKALLKYKPIDSLIKETCRLRGISMEEFFSDRRYRHIVVSRVLFCIVLYEIEGLAVVDLATIINRDHSSIIHYLNGSKDALTPKEISELDLLMTHYADLLGKDTTTNIYNRLGLPARVVRKKDPKLEFCRKYAISPYVFIGLMPNTIKDETRS